MLQLHIKSQTHLKQSIKQSSALNRDNKVLVQKDQVIPISGFYRDEKYENHIKIVAKEKIEGKFTWYAYQDHIYISPEGSLDNSEQPFFKEISEITLVPDTYSREEIKWTDFKCKVSKFFTVGEVTLYDYDRIPYSERIRENIIKLCLELDKIREDWGSPIIVTSFYRPFAVNQRVGGARYSQHLYGKAADLRPFNGQLVRFQSFLDRHWNDALGYGLKKGFVHIDNRSGLGWKSAKSNRVRWNY